MERKGALISELEQLDFSPELEIPETVELEAIEIDADIDGVALEREKYWIHDFLKSSAPLLNISSVYQPQPRQPPCPRPRTDVQDTSPLTPFAEVQVWARITATQLCTEADVLTLVVHKIERDELLG